MEKRIRKQNPKYIQDVVEPPKKVIAKPKKIVAEPPKEAVVPLEAIPIYEDIPQEDVIINRKDLQDKYSDKNPYWTTHFRTLNDNITKQYIDVVNKYGNSDGIKLPIIFDNGIANLQVKNEFYKPIKNKVSYKKLLNKEYETSDSKSDHNIASAIKFFINNLPSFIKYKDEDDLSYIINNDRLLLLEILDYSYNKKSSITTIKSKINAICRIFRLAYGTKNYFPYQKYAFIVSVITKEASSLEKKNILSELEKTKFIDFQYVLVKQQQLYDAFNNLTPQQKLTPQGYKLNQDLLLISLYSLIPPLRAEPFVLEYTLIDKEAEDDGNYIYLSESKNVYMELQSEKKKNSSITFNISKESKLLANILKESYELYPRKYVFSTNKKNIYKKKSYSALANNLISIFKDQFKGIRVGINSLRSSYYSYVNNEEVLRGSILSYDKKEEIATKMRTSVKELDSNYLKKQQNLPNPRIKLEQTDEEITKQDSYEKQLERNKVYQAKNKEKVKKQQLEYKQSLSKEVKNRNRILNYLNNSPLYYTKMKQETKDKYNFKQDANGRWI